MSRRSWGLRVCNLKSALSCELNEQSINQRSYPSKIDTLGGIIQKLKSASERTAQRDNFILPAELTSVKDEFVLKVINWRKKKIKMTSDEEAARVSSEFISEIRIFFREYINKVKTVLQTAANEIDTKFYRVYCSAEFNDKYQANQDVGIDLSGYVLPELCFELLELKDEQ